MNAMAPTLPAVGDQATASWADEVAQDVIDISGSANVVLKLTPPGTLSTVTTGTPTTWITLGNVTVPSWATQALVSWSLYGVLGPASEPLITMQLKIGTAAGDAIRMMGLGAATGRNTWSIHETITGLTSGVKSVTILCAWTSTANSFQVTTDSRISARFTFKP